MDHNIVSPTSSSPIHPRDFAPRSMMNNNNNNNNKTITGDNISQLSQPNSDISSLSAAAEINIEKYQRLATEYAKLRAQFVVVKKAVIDEQSKSGELQETLKLRDQTSRRMEQEMESLLFRNKQLTKRISVLQTDLEHDSTGAAPKHRSFLFADSAKNRSSSNASNASSVPSVDVDLFDEINQELKGKMEENERLRELITSIEEKRTEEVQSLDRKLKEHDVKAEQRIETLNGEIRSLSNAVNKMKSERTGLEDKLKQSAQQLKDSVGPTDELKQENNQLKNRLVIFEKQLMAAKQHIRIQQSQSPMHLQPPAPSSSSPHPPNDSCPTPLVNGIPRSGSFSGVIRSSGSFSRAIPRSGSLSMNHSGSPTLASLFSGQSQSSKDLSQLASANNQQTSPSHSSKSYQDIMVKQRIIGEFATKISEIVCALSTLHSNVSKKISILFALFNNNANHFYFFDISSVDSQPNEVNQNVPLNRSVYIMTILRKFSDYLKSGYDTHLVHLEEATHQFLSTKIRFYQQQHSDEAINKQRSDSTSDWNLIQQELKQLSGEIVEKFNDYINYLNKINPYISLCLNYWCKNLQEYDPTNKQLVKSMGILDGSKIASEDKREDLCGKHEQLANSVTNGIRIIGQICNYVKLLLSKTLLNSNYLTVFNHFLHRINALEKSFDETKQLFSSKVALEHDLGITVEKELLSVDDCILSSMVFFRKSIVDIRLMLEMHYFFFVDNSGSATGSQSASPLAITGQLIPEEDLEEDEDEDADEDEDQDDSVEENEQPQAPVPVEVSRTDKPLMVATVQPLSDSTKANCNENSEKNNSNSGSASTEDLKQLEEQINKYHRQLMQLKQEKEQWTIESELAQLKLEQEQRKVSELEIRVQSLISQQQSKAIISGTHSQPTANHQQSLNRANSNTNSLTSSSGKSLDANYAELGSISSAASLQSPTLDCFGTVNYPSILNDQSSVTLSEDLLFNELNNTRGSSGSAVNSKLTNSANVTNGTEQAQPLCTSLEPTQVQTSEYLQQKMTKLINTLQLTHSRAASYQQECNSIRARFLQVSKEKSDVELRLTDQDHTLAAMQEEYQTSVENYEFQLRTMSEHLAELNEKLTSQCEQIDILKYQAAQQQQSGKTSSTASSVAKTFRRSFKKS